MADGLRKPHVSNARQGKTSEARLSRSKSPQQGSDQGEKPVNSEQVSRSLV